MRRQRRSLNAKSKTVGWVEAANQLGRSHNATRPKPNAKSSNLYLHDFTVWFISIPPNKVAVFKLVSYFALSIIAATPMPPAVHTDMRPRPPC